MPTSSTSARQSSSSTSAQGEQKRAYWPIKQQKQQLQQKSASATSFKKKQNPQTNNAQHIKHISRPTALSSTATNLRNKQAGKQMLDRDEEQEVAKEAGSTLSLAGQLVQTGALSHDSLGSLHSARMALANEAYVGASGAGAPFGKSKSSFLVNSLQYPSGGLSQSSLQQASTSTSTAQLHYKSTQNNPANVTSSGTFSIKRNLNLKYIKTIIILLLALDLLITVFVHQFSSQDYLSIWFTSFKLRLSLLNLILSAIWFIVLIGAILFDVYFILLISCLVHLSSFVLLLIFSVIHFSRRIDYNTVNLTSLLALLFSIVVLHVYLIVLIALTVYLMQAVKRRQS